MSRFVVLVLDGFGIGAMEDVPSVRPADCGANTLHHILDSIPALRLTNLERLGLMNAAGFVTDSMKLSPTATFGTANLMHDGADTFFGHQEIMGTRPQKPFGEPIANKLDTIAAAIAAAGYSVEIKWGTKQRFVVVEAAVTVADNIECDHGQAFNVTAALDLISFERVRAIGELVRGIATVPRVIVFGGRGVTLDDLLAAVEEDGEYIGINAPRSGVYNCDYHCVHLGYGVDPTVQLPSILGRAGIPVFLLGKAADIIDNRYGVSLPMVPTPQVMEATARLLETEPHAFICANVQETDLCGHRERPDCYAEILQQADEGIGRLVSLLTDDDLMVIMADHGNDPTIGHSHHTRERVPLLWAGCRLAPGFIGERSTLSDVAATAAAFFDVAMPQNGMVIPLNKLRL